MLTPSFLHRTIHLRMPLNCNDHSVVSHSRLLCQLSIQPAGDKSRYTWVGHTPIALYKEQKCTLVLITLGHVYPCTLFQLFITTMVPPDPAVANDRGGLVKEGHLPSMSSLLMPRLWGRGLEWSDMQLSRTLHLVGSHCVGQHCILATPTEHHSFRYQRGLGV